MTLDEFMEAAKETAVCKEVGMTYVQLINYLVLGLSGEAGEVANEAKRITSKDAGELTEERRDRILGEVGDVLWYIAVLVDELGYDLSLVAEDNLRKLRRRHGGAK